MEIWVLFLVLSFAAGLRTARRRSRDPALMILAGVALVAFLLTTYRFV